MLIIKFLALIYVIIKMILKVVFIMKNPVNFTSIYPEPNAMLSTLYFPK